MRAAVLLVLAAALPAQTLTVAAGSSIQKAIDAAPATGAVIDLAPGVYREVLKISKPNLHLRGVDRDPSKTVIVFDNSAGASGGTQKSATVTVDAADFSAENLTFSNDFNATHPQLPQGSQALALAVTGDRAVFRHMRFFGNQDTVYAAKARQYFADCYIEGNVDFIFGDGKTVFENCEIHSTAHSSGYITAQGKDAASKDNGYVFNHCLLTAAAGVEHVWLGRPWRPFATVIFLNTEMGAHIEPAGWREWHPGETTYLDTVTYAEFRSSGPGAHASERDPHAHQLTADEAARYQTKPYLAGADHWEPAPIEPRQQLIDHLDGLARRQLEARREAVARVRSRAGAERRKAAIRQKITALIGGLPVSKGPVAVKSYGSIAGDGFRVEKLAFESLPGFWVTANVYVPTAGAGPFPAMVLTPGHEPNGKLGQYAFGVNFARLGIVSLAFDPIGQGERLQYFDSARKVSTVGAPTGEHGEANLPTLLIGDDLLRYMVHDAMRAIDYLTSRRDVDATRIGALGCSGGGTATAALAALDDRVQAAGTACYITSFEELLPSATGVQEAEQSIPHFIEQGLDLADWVEAAAPRPYAIISTTADMFPFEGARQTYTEAKRIYELYGAGDRLRWITGPGGHGNLGPISPDILGFFAQYLKGDTSAQTMQPARLANPNDLLCLPAGEMATSLGGETVASLNRKRAEEVIAARPKLSSSGLRQAIRSLAGVTVVPGSKPAVSAAAAGEPRSGYRIETTTLRSATGVDLGVLVAVPMRPGSKPPVVWMESRSKEAVLAAGGDVDRLAKEGCVVLVLEPQPWPQATESIKSPYLGSFNLLSLRAFLVGKTILGIRVDDAILALDWLCERTDVDSRAVTLYGNGALGMVALHAAVLDSRVGRLVVESSLSSYRSVVETPLHWNVSEVAIPGVLKKYDVTELLEALGGRPAVMVNAVDASGAAVPEALFIKSLRGVKGVAVRTRKVGEALPLE